MKQGKQSFLDVLTHLIKQFGQEFSQQHQDEVLILHQEISSALKSWFTRNGNDILCCLGADSKLNPTSRQSKETSCPILKPSLTNQYQESKLCDVTDTVAPLSDKGKTARPYMITLKNIYNNQLFVLKVSPALSIPLEYDIRIEDKKRQFDNPVCLRDWIPGSIYFGSKSDFLNESLIAMIIRKVWPTNIPQLFVVHHLSGTCDPDRVGLNFMRYSNRKTVEHFWQQFPQFVETKKIRSSIVRRIQPDIVKQIIAQVLIVLDLLKSKIQFSHGDLKGTNVFVTNEPVEFQYRGIQVKSSFQCQIADFGKSSATYQQIRFYPFNVWADLLSRVDTFQPSPLITKNQYILSDEFQKWSPFQDVRIFSRSRHFGQSYYESLDLYCFMCSLFVLPEFYQALASNSDLQEIWNLLWLNESMSQQVFADMYPLSKTHTHHPLRSILKLFIHLPLKCNALELLLDWFQKNFHHE